MVQSPARSLLAGLGEFDQRDPAVLLVTDAADQALLFEAVHQDHHVSGRHAEGLAEPAHARGFVFKRQAEKQAARTRRPLLGDRSGVSVASPP